MRFILLIITGFFFITASAQQQFAIYFESNKSAVTIAEGNRLDAWLNANKDAKIVAINGYTDEDGSTGFNDTLARRRVEYLHRQVKGKISIRDDFKTRSFGELHTQSAKKSENRKAVIYYLEPKDIPRENEILGIKPAAISETPKIKSEVSYPEKIVIENPDGTTEEIKLDNGFMKELGASSTGQKLNIKNLNFVINTFAVVPSSRGKLYELLIVMEKNPGLRIEIHGHLCCMPADKQDLSTKRAKAVYSFLAMKGIDKSRLSYKGFGSSEPIYPIPEKDDNERAANRRVEIFVVTND